MDRVVPASYALVFLWGIAVLLGMIGLGRLVAVAVGGEEAKKAGWGLHAVWGMGAFLFVGGALSLVGACGAPCIVTIILAGVAVTIWTTVRDGMPGKAALAAIPWETWPAFAAGALVFAGGLCWQMNVNVSDDLPAYYSFCEKLLATGSFDEPFSWRRLASLGGQTLLQCGIVAEGSYANAQAFEVALCPVILLGLVLGFRRGVLARSPLGLLLGLLAVSTPILRINSASHFTGVVLLVGLFVTLDGAERAAGGPAVMIPTLRIRPIAGGRIRWLAAAGVVAAGLCSLRASYVPAAGGALGLFWLASWIKNRPPLRGALAEAVWLGASVFLALLPWMVMGWLSNGTPLFPLFQGDNHPAFNPQATAAPFIDRVSDLLKMLFYSSLLPLVICNFAAPGWKQGTAARAVVIAGVLAALAVAYSIPQPPDTLTIPRYVQPMFLAGAMISLMTCAASLRARVRAWVLALIVMATSLHDRSEHLWDCYQQFEYTDRLVASFKARAVLDHEKAQSLVPEGKRVLVCSDFPFLFDFRRNPLWIIDLPNAACPAPGLPYGKPPEEMKRYLRGLGIEYVIFVNFDSARFYSRALRKKQLTDDAQMLRTEAPYFLDFFDTIERLAGSETMLGRAGDLTVIQFKP